MITEFGRCACGEWAAVKLNDVAVCLPCFEEGLAAVKSRIERAWRAALGAPASAPQEPRP